MSWNEQEEKHLSEYSEPSYAKGYLFIYLFIVAINTNIPVLLIKMLM